MALGSWHFPRRSVASSSFVVWTELIPHFTSIPPPFILNSYSIPASTLRLERLISSVDSILSASSQLRYLCTETINVAPKCPAVCPGTLLNRLTSSKLDGSAAHPTRKTTSQTMGSSQTMAPMPTKDEATRSKRRNQRGNARVP